MRWNPVLRSVGWGSTPSPPPSRGASRHRRMGVHPIARPAPSRPMVRPPIPKHRPLTSATGCSLFPVAGGMVPPTRWTCRSRLPRLVRSKLRELADGRAARLVRQRPDLRHRRLRRRRRGAAGILSPGAGRPRPRLCRHHPPRARPSERPERDPGARDPMPVRAGQRRARAGARTASTSSRPIANWSSTGDNVAVTPLHRAARPARADRHVLPLRRGRPAATAWRWS